MTQRESRHAEDTHDAVDDDTLNGGSGNLRPRDKIDAHDRDPLHGGSGQLGVQPKDDAPDDNDLELTDPVDGALKPGA